MDTQFVKTFRIHDSRIRSVVSRLETLSKVAVKLNMEAYQIDLGEAEHVPRPDGSGHVDSYIPLTFSGEKPVIEGWRFLAKLEHTEGGNVISSFATSVDKRYRDCPPNCDHCHTNRARNFTYVVESHDGEQLQVGSSCIDDFVGGHQDPKLILSLLDGLGKIDWEGPEPYQGDEESLHESPGASSSGLDLMRVLEVSCATIRRDGRYINATDAEIKGEIATKDSVSYAMLSGKVRLNNLVSPHDTELARRVHDWLLEEDPLDSVYRHNLRVMAKNEVLTNINRQLGLAVSAPAAYERHLRQAIAFEERPNLHIGEAGEKWVGRQVEFKDSFSFSTQWGSSFNCIMIDTESGAELKWRTASPLPFKKGERYFINASVKGHGEYRDMKQTELSRVTCPDLAVVGAAARKLNADDPSKEIRKLLKKSRDINAMDRNGQTALIGVAVYADDTSADRWKPVVSALLDAGADPLQSTPFLLDGSTALDVAMFYGEGSVQLTEMLLTRLKEQGVDPATLQTVLSREPDWSDVDSAKRDETTRSVLRLADEHGMDIHPQLRVAGGLPSIDPEPEQIDEPVLDMEELETWLALSDEVAPEDELATETSAGQQFRLGF